MSYKNELASNNVDLQTILDAVNKLPDKPQIITSTTEVEEGSESSSPENSLYVVYEE